MKVRLQNKSDKEILEITEEYDLIKKLNTENYLILEPIILNNLDNLEVFFKKLNPNNTYYKLIEEEIVKANGWFLKYIKNPSDKLILESIKSNPWAISFLKPKEQTKELKEIALYTNPHTIQYIHKPSKKMEIWAIKNVEMAINHINKIDMEKLKIHLEYWSWEYILRDKIDKKDMIIEVLSYMTNNKNEIYKEVMKSKTKKELKAKMWEYYEKPPY